jgi:ankyrin repeat protein
MSRPKKLKATPNQLLISAETGDIDAVIDLLGMGVDANAQDQRGETVLMKAVQRKKNYRVIEALLNAGANRTISCKDSKGETALLKAIQHNGTAILCLLRDAGASVEDRDNRGRNILEIANRSYKSELVAFLLQDPLISRMVDEVQSTAPATHTTKAKTTQDVADGETLLTQAVKEQDMNKIKLLLDARAGVRVVNGEGRCPLAVAWGGKLIARYKKIVHLLISSGADANIRNSVGRTLLFDAIAQNDCDMVSALLGAGAEVLVEDKEGLTSVMEAARAKSSTFRTVWEAVLARVQADDGERRINSV